MDYINRDLLLGLFYRHNHIGFRKINWYNTDLTEIEWQYTTKMLNIQVEK